MGDIDLELSIYIHILRAPPLRPPSLPEGEGAAPLEPALPPLHPLRPRGRLGEGGGVGGGPPMGDI